MGDEAILRLPMKYLVALSALTALIFGHAGFMEVHRHLFGMPSELSSFQTLLLLVGPLFNLPALFLIGMSLLAGGVAFAISGAATLMFIDKTEMHHHGLPYMQFAAGAIFFMLMAYSRRQDGFSLRDALQDRKVFALALLGVVSFYKLIALWGISAVGHLGEIVGGDVPPMVGLILGAPIAAILVGGIFLVQARRLLRPMRDSR